MNERMYYSREAEQRAHRERLTIAAFSLIIGASIAAVLALIFAPREGETRHELGKHFEEALNQSRKTVNHAAHDLRENADHLRDEVEERIEASRH